MEVLRDLTPSALEEGKQFINEKRIGIHLKEGIQEKLYIEVKCSTDDDSATAIISGGHTNFVYVGESSLAPTTFSSSL